MRNGRQFKVGKGFFSSMKESELPSYAGDKIPCEYTSFRLMRRSADEALGPHESGATDTEKQGNPAGNDMTAIAIEIPKDAHDAWDCFKTVDAQVKLCTELQLLLVRGGVA